MNILQSLRIGTKIYAVVTLLSVLTLGLSVFMSRSINH